MKPVTHYAAIPVSGPVYMYAMAYIVYQSNFQAGYAALPSKQMEFCDSNTTVTTESPNTFLISHPKFPSWSKSSQCQCKLSSKTPGILLLQAMLQERTMFTKNQSRNSEDELWCSPRFMIMQNPHTDFSHMICASNDENSTVKLYIDNTTDFLVLIYSEDFYLRYQVEIKHEFDIQVECKAKIWEGVNAIVTNTAAKKKQGPLTGVVLGSIVAALAGISLIAFIIYWSLKNCHVSRKWPSTKKSQSEKSLNISVASSAKSASRDKVCDNAAYESDISHNTVTSSHEISSITGSIIINTTMDDDDSVLSSVGQVNTPHLNEMRYPMDRDEFSNASLTTYGDEDDLYLRNCDVPNSSLTNYYRPPSNNTSEVYGRPLKHKGTKYRERPIDINNLMRQEPPGSKTTQMTESPARQNQNEHYDKPQVNNSSVSDFFNRRNSTNTTGSSQYSIETDV